jgi:hypothetical protein
MNVFELVVIGFCVLNTCVTLISFTSLFKGQTDILKFMGDYIKGKM